LPLVWIVISLIVGVIVGYLAASKRVREEGTRRFVEGVERGKSLADLDADPGPVELGATVSPRRIRRWRRRGHVDWKDSVAEAELHELLQLEGVGL
jgi:hypothetical protein